MNFKLKALLGSVMVLTYAIFLATARSHSARSVHHHNKRIDIKPPANTPGNIGGIGAITSAIINLVSAFTDEGKAWDTDKYPYMCKLSAESKNIGECKAKVSCKDSETREYGPFPYCNLDWVNTFEDEQIGMFSVMYTSKLDDTPAAPYFWIENIENGAKWDVEGIQADTSGNLCELKHHTKVDQTTDRATYSCGVPQTGKSGAGVDSEGPVNDRGYADGWCGLHVVQHQKPDPSKDNYTFDVTIKDNNEDVIGERKGMDIATDKQASVTSKLEWTVEIKAGAVDDDAVWMYYGDQAWSSNDQEHHCDFGAYDSGKREGDCGFSC